MDSLFSYFNENYFDVLMKAAGWVVRVTRWTEERGYEFEILGAIPVLRKVKWVQTSRIIDKTGSVDINVTLRPVRVTIFTVKICKYLYYLFRMCVCCVSYPACNAHAPYYIVFLSCTALLKFSSIFYTRHDFRENHIKKNWVLISSTDFFWNISRFYKYWARYYHKCTEVFIQGSCYSSQM